MSIVEAIEKGIGDDGAFEGGDGLSDQINGDLVGAPGFLDEPRLNGVRLKLLHDAIERMCHFDGIGDGTFGLFFEAGCAAIPELQGEVRRISHCGSMAIAGFLANTLRNGPLIRKGKLRGVAGGAGDGAIEGETWIVVQTAAKARGVLICMGLPMGIAGELPGAWACAGR
jgi:hypothetical protein